MVMGLIILAIFAMTLFFEFGRKTFERIGLPAWGAFIVLLAFAIGIIVPVIPFGGAFNMNVGGFIMPMLAMFALLYVIIRAKNVWRGFAAMLAVIAISTALLLIMPLDGMGWQVLTAFVIGVISGSVAYLVTMNSAASVFAVTGGVALGDLIYCLIDRFAMNGGVFTLGTAVVYNSIFVAAFIALAIAEAAIYMSKSGRGRLNKRASDFEAANDDVFDDDSDGFDDELF